MTDEVVKNVDNAIEPLSSQKKWIIGNFSKDTNMSITNQEYIDSLNKALKDKWLWDISVKFENWKFVREWTSKKGSVIDSQIDEYVNMLNWSENMNNAAWLADAIASSKYLNKFGNNSSATNAIKEWSMWLSDDLLKKYPKDAQKLIDLNSEIAEYTNLRNKVYWYNWNFTKVINDINTNATDFYKVAEELFDKGLTKKHYWKDVIWTYYTMNLRAPTQLKEVLRVWEVTPYPSAAWVTEEWIKSTVSWMQKAKWWLSDLWWYTNTPTAIWRWLQWTALGMPQYNELSNNE
jgi:hypothetical protein